MAKAGEKPTLRVEGKDDQHALCHLLIRHGIDSDSMPAEYPTIAVDEGKNGVLDGIEGNVKTHSGRAVGFVLDADWRAMDGGRRSTQEGRRDHAQQSAT